ncbi:hypothetical protein JCM30204_46160 [Dysgonomonas termitidis]|uniref:Bacteriocin n=1 Tax=Dysgonomonas termitidis TaxID=1516126 RepID=A0ABV9KZH6_9BACT
MRLADLTMDDFDLLEETDLGLIKGGRTKNVSEKKRISDNNYISNDDNFSFFLKGYRH